jgi:hypothetical protein
MNINNNKLLPVTSKEWAVPEHTDYNQNIDSWNNQNQSSLITDELRFVRAGKEDIMTDSLGILVVIIIAIILLASSIKIASDHQRFAVYALGQYKGLKGPGLFVKLLGGEKWIRISIGDRFELISPNVAKVDNFAVPVEADGKVPINSFIRVTGFKDNSTVLTISDANQRRTIKCEKCGHEIKV